MKEFDELSQAIKNYLVVTKLAILSDAEIVEFSVALFRTRQGEIQFGIPSVSITQIMNATGGTIQ